MPTLRDLVRTLRQREGVAAALVVGRDGLLVEGAHDAAVDPDTLAAHLPPLLLSAAALGAAAGPGTPSPEGAGAGAAPQLLVGEVPAGALVVTPLGADAALLVLVRPEGDLARLVQDLRRHRARLAALT